MWVLNILCILIPYQIFYFYPLIFNGFLFGDGNASQFVALVSVVTIIGEGDGWGAIGIADGNEYVELSGGTDSGECPE